MPVTVMATASKITDWARNAPSSADRVERAGRDQGSSLSDPGRQCACRQIADQLPDADQRDDRAQPSRRWRQALGRTDATSGRIAP